MVDLHETKCQLLHVAGSVQRMVARDSSGAGKCSHDRQSQRRQIKMDRYRQAKELYVLNFCWDSADKKTGHDCPSKDGKHPLWKCEKFLKMTCQARYEKAKELKLCFCCLAGKHVAKDCTYKVCGVKGCSRRHHRLLHREANKRPKESGGEDPQRKEETRQIQLFVQ